MGQKLFLRAFVMLGLAVLTTNLAHAQLESLPYIHVEDNRHTALKALEASASDCLTLTHNTVLQDDAPCLFVGGGVIVDLNGHTVFGNILELDSGDHITIKNGTVAEGAIVLLGAHNRLKQMIVRDSNSTFAVQLGGGSVISHSVFERNVVAVDLYWGGDVEVRRSVFRLNHTGVNITSDNHSFLHSNVFWENETGVRIWDEDFSGSSGNIIDQNAFHNNGIGVFLDAHSEANDNHLQGNWFFSNESSAIVVRLACERVYTDQCAGRGTQIHGNWLVQNGGQAQVLSGTWWLSNGEQQDYEVVLDDGLTVVALPELDVANGVTVTRNLALFNADLGISAPGVIDGGLNYGVFNGNAEQCAWHSLNQSPVL